MVGLLICRRCRFDMMFGFFVDSFNIRIGVVFFLLVFVRGKVILVFFHNNLTDSNYRMMIRLMYINIIYHIKSSFVDRNLPFFRASPYVTDLLPLVQLFFVFVF